MWFQEGKVGNVKRHNQIYMYLWMKYIFVARAGYYYSKGWEIELTNRSSGANKYSKRWIKNKEGAILDKLSCYKLEYFILGDSRSVYDRR